MDKRARALLKVNYHHYFPIVAPGRGRESKRGLKVVFPEIIINLDDTAEEGDLQKLRQSSSLTVRIGRLRQP